MKKTRWFLMVFVLLLAACGGTGSDGAAQVPTEFVLPSVTDAPTQGPTEVPSWTPTPTPTLTPTATPTETVTVTPSMTITDTPIPTLTPTITPTPDTGAISALMALAYNATVLPSDFQAGDIVAGGGPPAPVDSQATQTITNTSGCGIPPSGGFGTVFANDAAIQQRLGCPVVYHFSAASASQIFERGVMIWLDGAPTGIYVLTMDGQFQRYDDTYDANVDPISGGEVPPANLLEPVRGFGKIWRSFSAVRTALGWALTAESATQATIQSFQNGRMIFLPTRGDILVFTDNPGGGSGTWVSVPGTF